jgi:hypothetical protein
MKTAASSVLAGLSNGKFFDFFSGYKKKVKNPWGVVYDKYSKKPIANVLVYLFSWPDHKLIGTQKTNSLGEFAFLAPSGQYYFKVEKRGYFLEESENSKEKNQMITMSTQILSKFKPFSANKTDGYYSNLYSVPEIITQRGESKQLLQVAIPMIPANAKPSGWIRFWHKFIYVLEVLRLPILIIGSFFAVLNILSRAAWYDWLLAGIYAVFWIIELYLLVFKPKTWGEIVDEKGKPVELALIRLINRKTERIIATEVTGRDGRFAFNVNPGEYVIKISKEGIKDYYSEPLAVKKMKNLGHLKFVI